MQLTLEAGILQAV